MRKPDRVMRMASEQTNLNVDASSEEFRKAGVPRISDRIHREHGSDSRDDADCSKIQSPRSRRRTLLHSEKVRFRRSSLGSAINDETLASLIALARELTRVRRRLITEGYVIDGKRIYKP